MAEETKPDTQKDGAAATQVEKKPEEKVTPTVEEIQKDESQKPQTVGLDKYLDEKKARKEAEEKAEALAQEITELKATPGKSKEEVEEDIAELAKAHNIDETFLQRVATSIYTKATKEIEAKLLPEVSKITAKEKAEQIDKKFGALFDKTLEENPEYQGIVNRDVIKKLALDPTNAKKTLPQILEEAYGGAVTGKKTIEAGATGAKTEKIDFSKVTASDLERINADPALKKQYNEYTEKEVRNYL